MKQLETAMYRNQILGHTHPYVYTHNTHIHTHTHTHTHTLRAHGLLAEWRWFFSAILAKCSGLVP